MSHTSSSVLVISANVGVTTWSSVSFSFSLWHRVHRKTDICSTLRSFPGQLRLPENPNGQKDNSGTSLSKREASNLRDENTESQTISFLSYRATWSRRPGALLHNVQSSNFLIISHECRLNSGRVPYHGGMRRNQEE